MAPIERNAPEALPPPLPPFPPPPAVATPGGAIPPPLEVADDGWQDTTPAPWRRYFARQFDTAVLGLVAWALVGIAAAFVAPQLFDTLLRPEVVENMFVSAALTYLLAMPVVAVLVGLTGSSPGKWLFGVRVTRRDGRPIGLADAAMREARVWIRGMGLALPLVSLITLGASYGYLEAHRVAPWDRGRDWVVTHRPHRALQKALFVLGVASVIALSVAVRLMPD
jgi:uncharacterized RDD family membrane protein YckC